MAHNVDNATLTSRKLHHSTGRDQIEGGIVSLQRQIAAHEAKIADPASAIPEWSSLDPRQQQALVTSKWPGDIARQQEQIDILRGILGGRR